MHRALLVRMEQYTRNSRLGANRIGVATSQAVREIETSVRNQKIAIHYST